MGEHVGKGPCGASIQGGLFADHLAAHAGTSGSLGARARAMEFADSCCTDARRFCGTFSRRASHRQPAGPRSARAGRGVRLGGPLARSQRAEVVTAPRVYGQHGEQVVGQRREGARTHHTRWSPPGFNPLSALPCAHHTHALRMRHGGVALPATRTRWWPPRAHTARRVFCTLGATTH